MWGKTNIGILSIFLALLFGCRSEEAPPSSQDPSNSHLESPAGLVQDEVDGPSTPPIAYAAPPPDASLVFAQVYDLALRKSVVTGLPGSVVWGVDSVFARLSNDPTAAIFSASIDPNGDGSFRVLMDNVTHNDEVLVWADGANFALRGGPGINDIQETVQTWSRYFPSAVFSTLLTSQNDLYVGADDGLYRFPSAKLTGAPGVYVPEKFTQTHQIPSLDIQALAEDSLGRVWVGTDQGLALHVPSSGRKQFSVFTTADGIASNNILTLAFQSPDLLWIGTDQGLSVGTIDPSGIVSIRNFTTAEGMLDNHINCLAVDKSGQLFAGTPLGLNVITSNPEQVLSFVNDPNEPVTLPGNSVFRMVPRSDLGVWMSTNMGLAHGYVVDGEGIFWDYSGSPYVPNETITALATEGSSALWVGTLRSGVTRLALSSGLRLTITGAETFNQGLPASTVTGIAASSTGMAWVGTRFGLGVIDSAAHSAQTYASTDGLPGNHVMSVVADPDRGTWIATDGGLSLLTFPGGKTHFENYFIPLGNSNLPSWARPQALALQGSQRLWIGTSVGLSLATLSPTGITQFQNINMTQGLVSYSVNVNALAVANGDRVFVGASNGLTMITEPSPGTFVTETIVTNERIEALTLEGADHVWFTTKNGLQLATLSPTGVSQIKAFTSADGLPAFPLYGVTPAGPGKVWVGSFGGGISLVSLTTPNTISVKTFLNDPNQPLSITSNRILTVAVDGDGKLWAGTISHGVMQLEFNNSELVAVKSLDLPDGLPSSKILGIGIDSSKSAVYLGSDEGLTLLVSP